jgi:hypothetical protein
MITGYNTDVEHDGVVYHVQTEDKGIETPLVLSLVYSGGAILASKRSSYHDLIAAGFDEAVLTERLQRQHRLICAAINAGRIADLKKMGPPPRQPPQAAPKVVPSAPTELHKKPPEHDVKIEQARGPLVAPPQSVAPEPFTLPIAPEQTGAGPLPPPAPTHRPPSAYTVYDSRRRAPGKAPEIEEGLRISLVGEKNYRGGDAVELQVTVTRVSSEGEAPATAAVSVKILGTSFRPVIISLKTNRQGTATLSTRIPQFKTGRAAIVIRATAADLSSETRRVIHPG